MIKKQMATRVISGAALLLVMLVLCLMIVFVGCGENPLHTDSASTSDEGQAMHTTDRAQAESTKAEETPAEKS